MRNHKRTLIKNYIHARNAAYAYSDITFSVEIRIRTRPATFFHPYREIMSKLM